MTQPNPAAASVKRYGPVVVEEEESLIGVSYASMDDDPDGDWVTYEDYAKAIAERDAAQRDARNEELRKLAFKAASFCARMHGVDEFGDEHRKEAIELAHQLKSALARKKGV